MGKDHHAAYMMALDTCLAEFAFTDCLHDHIGCNDVQVSAAANQEAGTAKLVDEAGNTIGRIQHHFHRIFLKYRLGTFGFPQLLLDITAPLLFAHPVRVIIHDDPLPQRFMSRKPQGIV